MGRVSRVHVSTTLAPGRSRACPHCSPSCPSPANAVSPRYPINSPTLPACTTSSSHLVLVSHPSPVARAHPPRRLSHCHISHSPTLATPPPRARTRPPHTVFPNHHVESSSVSHHVSERCSHLSVAMHGSELMYPPVKQLHSWAKSLVPTEYKGACVFLSPYRAVN